MEAQNGLDIKECHHNSELLLSLAKAYFVLQTKALGFHWNVVGPQFIELHKFFEETYDQLSDLLDSIAERMRMLGTWAPMGVSMLVKDALLQDSPGVLAPARMLEALEADYHTILLHLRALLKELDHSADEGTKDLMIGHLRIYEKKLWSIRSLVQKL